MKIIFLVISLMSFHELSWANGINTRAQSSAYEAKIEKPLSQRELKKLRSKIQEISKQSVKKTVKMIKKAQNEGEKLNNSSL